MSAAFPSLSALSTVELVDLHNTVAARIDTALAPVAVKKFETKDKAIGRVLGLISKAALTVEEAMKWTAGGRRVWNAYEAEQEADAPAHVPAGQDAPAPAVSLSPRAPAAPDDATLAALLGGTVVAMSVAAPSLHPATDVATAAATPYQVASRRASRRASTEARVADRIAAASVEAPMKATRGPSAKHAAVLEAAARGVLPEAPDFSKPTHAAYRKRLAQVVALVEDRDPIGLRAFEIKITGDSSKALDRYRVAAATAIEFVFASIGEKTRGTSLL